MISDKSGLRDLLVKHQLEAGLELLAPRATPAYYLHVGHEETYSRTGNSRVGGVPDLPRGWAWPKTDEGYLNFMMQINLAELERFDGSPLPGSGILYYFVETEDDGELTRVLYFEGEAEDLGRANSPSEDEFLCDYFTVIQPHTITAHLGLDVPGFGSDEADEVMDAAEDAEDGDSTDRFAAFERELKGIRGPEQSVGQLLGYVDRFGDNPQKDAVLVKADRSSLTGSGRLDTVEKVEQSMAKHAAAGRTRTVEYCRRHIDNLKWYDQNRAWVDNESRRWIPFWTVESNMAVELLILDAGNFEMFVHVDDLTKRDFSNLHIEVASS